MSPPELIQHLDDVELFVGMVRRNPRIVEGLEAELECVQDLSHTLEKLESGQRIDEIELFQLKNFCIVVQSVREKARGALPDRLLPPDLRTVLDILDPEGLRMPTFYIYDSYDERLRQLRRRKLELIKVSREFDDELVELSVKERELEEEIITKLSLEISAKVGELREGVEKIGLLDVLISKGRVACELGLSKPRLLITDGSARPFARAITMRGMFNPALRARVEEAGGSYQPIDISVNPGVSVIVGANMTGKSVTLRTVALVTYMAHLGFFVPCEECEIPEVDLIAIVAEDQSEPLGGLSSFAAEVLAMDEILDELGSGARVALVLIDEPARTTNPHEGVAIVNAICELLDERNVYALIVTHFDEVRAPRKLRVKGLKRELVEGKLSGVARKDLMAKLHECVDYGLVELGSDDVDATPKEALLIMELLDVNRELIERARNWLMTHRGQPSGKEV